MNLAVLLAAAESVWTWVALASIPLAIWLLRRVAAVAESPVEKAISSAFKKIAVARASRAAKRRHQKSAKLEAKILEEIRKERIGRRFIRHAFEGDSGQYGEVTDLGMRDAKRTVVTQWTTPAERGPQIDDYPTDRPTTVEWKVLTRSREDQIHWTARMRANSDDDGDGWVEFEPTRD